MNGLNKGGWGGGPGPFYTSVLKFLSTLVSRISVQARISVQGGILTKIKEAYRPIMVQGGILIKILEYRVKTGNFIDNKKDF